MHPGCYNQYMAFLGIFFKFIYDKSTRSPNRFKIDQIYSQKLVGQTENFQFVYRSVRMFLMTSMY